MSCPASTDNSLSSPTYYSDPFSKYSTQYALQIGGKNRDLYATSVTNLQSMELFMKESEFNKLVTILVKETTEESINIQDSTLKGKLQQKTKDLIAHLELEYCFYYRAYSKLLELYLNLTTISETSWNTSTTQESNSVPTDLRSNNTTAVNQKTEVLGKIATVLVNLNNKLTNITDLNVSISNTLKGMIDSFRKTVTGDVDVDGSTAKLDMAVLKLQESNPKNLISDLESNRRSIEYTQEKNRYTSIYLGLYAFLNISALAVLLHIASGD
jgi:hypothetical protein